MAIGMKQIRVAKTTEIAKLIHRSRNGLLMHSADFLFDGSMRFVYKTPELLDNGYLVRAMFIQHNDKGEDLITLTIEN